MKYVVIFFLGLSVYAQAGDQMHREMMWQVSIHSALQNYSSTQPWVSPSTIRLQKGASDIVNASGKIILTKPTVATSAYDPTVQYDVSHFYKLKQPTYAFVINFPAGKPGRFFSIGYNSAAIAKKITVNPSIFLGYVDTHTVAKNQYLTISTGSWFGGNISESPCYDTYDRAYSCSSLIAWNDYRPNYPRQFNYMDVKYKIRF